MSQATATEIIMPRLSDSMEEGTILAWLVAAGEAVTSGQDLFEVETDKANMTVQSEGSGILEILAEDGTTLAVGEPIARLLEPGAEAASVSSATEVETASDPVSESPEPVPPVPAAAVESGRDAPAPPKGRAATPLARRAAAAHGVSIKRIGHGSGIGGRVVKADVLAAAGIEVPAPAITPAPDLPVAPPAAPGNGAVETAKGGAATVEPSRLQAVIARRMAESKATVPHFQVETEVRMDAAIALRAELKALVDDGPAPSFTDLIVRAAALALHDHPKANASYRDGVFELHDRVNVGVAVAADEALVVPTIFDADRMSLGEISRETRRLAKRVRDGTVTPPELAGGTFTVSNLGMFGMTAIYPVVNLPQAAILGVGAMRPVLLRGEDGEIADQTLMTLTLSCDHRILYGAEAAEFLGAIRNLLETPLRAAL